MKIKTIMASLFLMTNANIALSDSYIGASYGQSEVDVSGYTKPSAYKMYGGMRSVNFGLEIGYNNLGKFVAPTGRGNLDVNITGLELSGVGYIPLNNEFELFGKIGMFSWNNNASLNGITVSESGAELTYGAGGQFKIMPSLAIRAEYQKFTNISYADVSTISVGALYSF